MANLKFAKTHNLVAYLEKPEESDGFKVIIDFLNASSIRYALTIQALVDGKKVIVNETSVRRALQLKDAECTECLPNATIFVELERMSAKTTAWNEFSSTMASAIICLVTNQKFNFSKYIFDNMVKNLEGRVKFLMYPREGKGFSGRVTPLFQTMMVQAPEELGVFDEQEVEVEKVVSNAEVTTASTTTTTVDELTLAQTLIEIKAAKPKAVTTTTTAVTRPKARRVVVQEPTKMEADYELAQRLHAEEQGELTIKERSKLFIELMDKRKKHFAKLKAKEIIRKPSTKAQKRNQMCTYLKNMANYKHSQLKNKSFEEIQMLFDNTMKWVDSFVPMDTEVIEGSKKRTRE
ncbi:hypothetical protein Tco_1027574 [Tanacetum coccineum]